MCTRPLQQPYDITSWRQKQVAGRMDTSQRARQKNRNGTRVGEKARRRNSPCTTRSKPFQPIMTETMFLYTWDYQWLGVNG